MHKRIRLLCITACFLLTLSILVPNAPAQAAPATETALKWTSQSPANSGTSSTNGTWMSVAWSPELGKFAAVSSSSVFPAASVNRIITSPEGETWTTIPAPATRPIYKAIAWSPDLGMFAAIACTDSTACTVSSTGDFVSTSSDGVSWTNRPLTGTDAGDDWQSIIWSPELDLFVAVGNNLNAGTLNRVVTSPDGITWTPRIVPEANAWNEVAWSPELGLLVAVAGNGTSRIMTSPDGINWTSRTAAAQNTWTSVTWSPERDLFVAVSSDGTNHVMTSPDGINWTPRTATEASAWTSITWSPEHSQFVVVASSGANKVMSSSDGINWAATPAASNNGWQSIVWSPEKQAFVAVANSGTNTTKVMTGAAVTATTDDATGVEARAATLHGDYQDPYPSANVFFRYRVVNSGDPFTETTPQPVTTSGAFTADITGLTADNVTYEYTSVVQWPADGGVQELEGGLQTFTTLLADDDNDSVPNLTEDAAPNGGDANDDGTPDSTQPFVASFVNSVTNKYAVLELDSVCQIDVVEVRLEANNAIVDLLYEYPIGLMSFTADCGTPGFAANATQYYYDASGNYVLRKYNPHTNAYFTLDDATQQTVSIGGQSAIKTTFAITDGGSRDMNGAMDGIIVDPAGLAVAVASGNTISPASGSSESLANTGQNIVVIVLSAIFLVSAGIASMVRFSMKERFKS